MQKLFDINSSQSTYGIYLDHSRELLTLIDDYDAIIADDFFKSQFGSDRKIIYITANEENKSYNALEPIFLKFKELKINRSAKICAIGGGVIQDIATFVCSLYMRGVLWTYYPTTYLGMADSCIGGKSSINLGNIKNLIGNFYPPTHIVINPYFLTTLPKTDVVCGLLEAIKICYAKSPEAFIRIIPAVNDYLDTGDIGFLQNILIQSLTHKKWFIEIDEFDRKERQLLNFGHTFGHAIEANCNYAIPHGIAVGLGMKLAYLFSSSQAKTEPRKLVELIDRLIEYADIITPELISQVDHQNIFSSFTSDKKHKNDYYVVIVFDEKGALFQQPVTKEPAQEQQLRTLFNDVPQLLQEMICEESA